MSDQSTLRTIEKLGHGLAEVRLRALNAIKAKLEHQLTTMAELNETPDFARRLMEWFNYPTPVEVDYVLSLILDSVNLCGETFVQLGTVWHFAILEKLFFAIASKMLGTLFVRQYYSFFAIK